MNNQKAIHQPRGSFLAEREDFDIDNMGRDVPKMHLVPCRWERSGWKYVQIDPKEHNFFNNPNRVNSFGIKQHAKGPRRGSVQRTTLYNPNQHSAFDRKVRRESDTTYGRFFSETR